MKKLNILFVVFCIAQIVLTSCENAKEPTTTIDKTTIQYNKIMEELTDSLCYIVVASGINKEIKQNVDFSECIIRLGKYPDVVYSNRSSITGEGFFHGKVKSKKGDYFYNITLKCNNKRLKDKNAWEVQKLIIKEAGKTEPFFVSGKDYVK